MANSGNKVCHTFLLSYRDYVQRLLQQQCTEVATTAMVLQQWFADILSTMRCEIENGLLLSRCFLSDLACENPHWSCHVAHPECEVSHQICDVSHRESEGFRWQRVYKGQSSTKTGYIITSDSWCVGAGAQNNHITFSVCHFAQRRGLEDISAVSFSKAHPSNAWRTHLFLVRFQPKFGANDLTKYFIQINILRLSNISYHKYWESIHGTLSKTIFQAWVVKFSRSIIHWYKTFPYPFQSEPWEQITLPSNLPPLTFGIGFNQSLGSEPLLPSNLPRTYSVTT